MNAPADRRLAVVRQGHYAGVVTRLAALVVDQLTATAVYALMLAFVEGAIDFVVAGDYQMDPPQWVVLGGWLVWMFLYYTYPWAVSGKTFGMSLLGIRVVARDGSPLRPRRAALRTIALPLSFATFGLGFAIALVQRERRALHDLIAGSAVVYDWDARAAQLRFLASRHATMSAAGPGTGQAGVTGGRSTGPSATSADAALSAAPGSE